MFRIVNKIYPESPHDKFAERSTITKYGTRNKTDLQTPRLNLAFSRRHFNYIGLKTWNSIPTHIRESNTLTRFKNGLKYHFSKLKEKLLTIWRTNPCKNSTGFYICLVNLFTISLTRTLVCSWDFCY